MTTPDRTFWQNLWDQAQLGFHEGKPNALLVAHVDRLERASKQRVLVPLAGKAADLPFLAARGHEVVGIEFVVQAIEQFFAEQGLDPSAHRADLGPHPAFTAGGVTMVAADMFAAHRDHLGTFDAIYDRAALVAIEPSMRARYVETCRALLREDGVTLLIALSYDQSKAPGPPWSLDATTVHTLFLGRRVEVIEQRDVPTSPRLAAAGLAALTETAYLIGP